MPHELLGEGPIESSAPLAGKSVGEERVEWVLSEGPGAGAGLHPPLVVNARGELQLGGLPATANPSVRVQTAARRLTDPAYQVHRMAIGVSLALVVLLAWVVW